jgi:DNA (cytosine-5)-methyltransferase 1
MKYGSVCSGIEAATVAWEPLGWKPQFFSEVEAFPSAVLAHHYQNVPNYGDMTKFKEWPDATFDVLVGGTPCQSFSVAGLRKGLDDPRGNLMLTYLAIAKRYRPRWVVWENVPGVLSSNGGRDFGTLLGGLAKLGYGTAYRVLDAQYVRVESHARAVPQRRRRVFVVGCLGDWRRSAAVLFERESLRWHPAPSRKTGQSVAALTARGVGTCGADDNQGQAGHLIHVAQISPTVSSGPPFSRTGNDRVEGEALVCMSSGQANAEITRDISPALNCNRDGAPIAFPAEMSATQCAKTEDVSPSLSVKHTTAVAFAQNSRDEVKAITSKGNGECWESDTHMSLSASGGGQAGQGYPAVRVGTAVRRLTPRECERLQGFPDDYTKIQWRGKSASHCPDGPRYKALGNSMATNCMRWIGERIQMVEELCQKK